MRTIIELTAKAFGLAAIFSLIVSSPAQTSYEASIEAWRADREARLKTDDGWLAVAGLYWLKEGVNTVGAGPGSDMVLPPGSAPDAVGTFAFSKGTVTFRAAEGAGVTSGGKPIAVLEMKTDATGSPDRLAIRDLTLMIIKRGERYGVRLKDKQNRNRSEFAGLRWYPVNASFRVTAKLIPHKAIKEIEIVNILGEVERMKTPGVLVFRLKGRQFRLEPIGDSGRLFIIFRDSTTGKTTYPAGRYLYADAPSGGSVTLDFNQAINPPCAFTSFATCPLPPRQNSIKMAIEAGEQTYHAPNATSRDQR